MWRRRPVHLCTKSSLGSRKAFPFRKWASSSSTRTKKASNRSLRRGAPKTAKKWSSGATTPATGRERTLARPSAGGATPSPRGGRGERGGGGSWRWRRRDGATGNRWAVNRYRCCRGRPASASRCRPLRPPRQPTARSSVTTLEAIRRVSSILGLKNL